MIDYVLANADEGNVTSVIKSIDQFVAKYDDFTMHIGAQKGELLDQVILEAKPRFLLDCGTYFGYSAIRMACSIPCNGAKIFSVEREDPYFNTANKLVEFAGLTDQIEIFLCSTDDALPKYENGFDLVLLDHYAVYYLNDLLKLEELNLLNENAVVIADNAIFHEKELDAYLNYVRTSGRYKSKLHARRIAHHNNKVDGMEISYWLGGEQIS